MYKIQPFRAHFEDNNNYNTNIQYTCVAPNSESISTSEHNRYKQMYNINVQT